MGTPDFAVPPLKALADYPCNIRLVLTQPDRPKGRGRQMVPPPVKQAALELGLEVAQPQNMKGKEIREKLTALQPDYLIVVAFGHKLPQEILDIPAIHPVNIHASLLPAYRGSAPIQAAILNRDKETGITTMVMDKELDSGDMLLTARTPIASEETAQDLHDRLAGMGADLIIKTMDVFANNKIKPITQDHTKATFAPMLKKEDGRIDWNRSPESIHALVRAMTPWPGTFTFIKGKRVKIFKVSPLATRTDVEPGIVFQTDKAGIHVAAKGGSVLICELQGSSGKRMNAADYLRGNPLKTGYLLKC